MATFTVETTVEAPLPRVWHDLADIGNIYAWNPGVLRSHTTSEAAGGIGAARYCDLGGGNFLDEEVVQWQPHEQLTMRIVGTNLPFETADIHFYLRAEDGATSVTVAPEYELKYGLFGRLLDRLYVRRVYAKGMAALLQGLKDYVEASPEAAPTLSA